MNNPWAYSLIGLALAAMFASRDVPRAWMWIGIGGASFVASSLFWDFASDDLRLAHPIFTFTCDALVCVCLHKWTEEKWELGVFLAFLTSVFASLLRIGGFIPDHIVYASLLELCNLCALLVIGGTGVVQMAARRGYGAFPRFHSRLHSPRSAVF